MRLGAIWMGRVLGWVETRKGHGSLGRLVGDSGCTRGLLQPTFHREDLVRRFPGSGLVVLIPRRRSRIPPIALRDREGIEWLIAV
jgi:hypothetical protein